MIDGLDISKSASKTYALESIYLATIEDDILLASLYTGFSRNLIIGYL